MAMETRLSLRQSQRVVMTPLLQQAIQLLQLSTLELQEVVQKELLENPLLEEMQPETSEQPDGKDAPPDVPTAPPAEPPASPLTPREELAAFRVAPGFRVELAACEPNVIDPVAMAFDEDGRLFVVEMLDYPNGPAPGQPPEGRIKLLEDKDGDGRYETATVFADKLLYGNGVLPWKDGPIGAECWIPADETSATKPWVMAPPLAPRPDTAKIRSPVGSMCGTRQAHVEQPAASSPQTARAIDQRP